MKTQWYAILLAVVAMGAVACGDRDPGPSAETQKQADRLAQIQQRTGSDWNKLTPDDKDYLVNQLAHGSESTAKMLLGPPSHKPGKPGGQ
ncbi:MAG TPA: hypothetical protein VMI31_06620 [Fimbriimonadaceae bacterium]|nr:hypothetical protein [Fimbriimonadaceae bacterium]